MNNYVTFRGTQGSNTPNTGRGMSPGLWGDCPLPEVILGNQDGVHFFDDFLDFGLPGTQTTEINLGRYKVYNTGAGTIATNASLGGTLTSGGIISMLADTAGDGSAIATQASPFLLTGSTTNSGPMWLEARMAITGIATNNAQWFFGLGDNSAYTLGAAKPLGDANAVASDVPFLGLQVNEDGLGVVRGVYADEAATWTEVEDSVGTFAANTFAKVGLKYDPSNSTSCVQFYFNGIPASSVISAATLAGLTNMDAHPLGIVWAMFADSAGTSTYGYCDWIRACQLSP